MKNPVDQFLADCKKLSLTAGEKQVMRAGLTALFVRSQLSMNEEEASACRNRLVTFMAAHPAVERRFTFSFLHLKVPTAILGSLLVIVTSTGITAVAAEESMPGDFLYTVKLNVTEPLRGKLWRKPAEKAEYAALRLERRMKEAEFLAENALLTDQQREAIEQRINLHQEELAQKLGGCEKDVQDRLQAQMDTAFSRHEEKLTQLQHEDRPQVRRLVEHIRRNRRSLRQDPTIVGDPFPPVMVTSSGEATFTATGMQSASLASSGGVFLMIEDGAGILELEPMPPHLEPQHAKEPPRDPPPSDARMPDPDLPPHRPREDEPPPPLPEPEPDTRELEEASRNGTERQ